MAVVEVNRDNFDTEVVQFKGIVVVDFWGPQCKPCLALTPTVEKLERNFQGKLKMAKLNAAENRMLCAKLKVLGLPTFLFYKDGVEVNRLTGEQIREGDLLNAINSLLS